MTPVFEAAELEGKKLVIVVWDTECNTCIRNMASLNPQLRQLIREKKASLISITPGTKERALEVLRYTPVEHTDMLASAKNLLSDLKIRQFPAVILTDRNHMITLAASGNDHEFYTLVKSGLKTN
ncbi:MAG: redoxin domain-containing protein [Chitinophagaceae bacterium]|nr:MAG: redoxin domain-containing protein [Chitinophagaceae bacterium]